MGTRAGGGQFGGKRFGAVVVAAIGKGHVEAVGRKGCADGTADAAGDEHGFPV
ncbi:hypothetical protein ACFQ4K_34100 [Tistrella bauzanensis]